MTHIWRVMSGEMKGKEDDKVSVGCFEYEGSVGNPCEYI